jgi:dimethylhistidine N-methyltransferase
MTILKKNTVHLVDHSPSTGDFASEVITGLRKAQKELKPKYFYDETGSRLFEKITELPEYYVTRTELSILQQCRAEISETIGEEAALIEFGSGSSTKVKYLLDNLEQPSYYVPIDIAKEMLLESAEAIDNQYENIDVLAICADFTKAISIPDLQHKGKKVIFYPGSTLGNFDPQDANLFLNRVHGMLDKGDGLLIGIDLKKDREILNRAYNDNQGVTASGKQFIQRILTNTQLRNFNPWQRHAGLLP